MSIEARTPKHDVRGNAHGRANAPPTREQVEAALAGLRRRRAVKLSLDGRPVWIKRARSGPGYTMYGLQMLAATALAMPVLRPPRVSRGPAGLAAEARRLRRLQRRGWPVPDVIDVTDSWLIISDIGPSLNMQVGPLPPPERAKMLRGGLARMQRLHGEGGWHGGAKIANVTHGPAGYGFIDFEDDIEPSMRLSLRQARDVLVFCMGASRYADDDPTLVAALIGDAHQSASPQVDAELKAIGVKLARASRLMGPLLTRLGREGRALARIGEVYRRR